ncbi:hypothetical protein AMTRI_Chr08g207280 [Amborella trichopoda]|uniref:chitinase 2 isoform X1 n=1 Tax=Amborella trichopoda TaxID=13333 RepID=UPI0005D407E9|nr:chitinase 2 isoform X1 [Amborella trichopoda]|eukprot:XP_011627232.1 chitinase 2 isoform X1 [Amborella trichopoda]
MGMSTILCLALLLPFYGIAAAANGKLFREYIGANFKNVKFSDVPINQNVDFHFILSFAIDYTSSGNSPSPTNGKFNVFWDTNNLSPTAVQAIKGNHPNVKVALSIGGDSVGNGKAFFTPVSVSSWVDNAVSSLTNIIKSYNLDGIDINYEHFKSDSDTFAECIGRLISQLKGNKVISFASIAPFADDGVQAQYKALWAKYGSVVDYVNFQFYGYDKGTTVSQFIGYFEEQRNNYGGGKVLVSFISDRSGGLAPGNGFFNACKELKSNGKLFGIFVWCADISKGNGFQYEQEAQALLAS